MNYLCHTEKGKSQISGFRTISQEVCVDGIEMDGEWKQMHVDHG